MMQSNQGNAVPNHREGSATHSDSGSYTYSTSSDDELETPGRQQLQQYQRQQQQQQQQQPQATTPPPVQASPVSVQKSKGGAKKDKKADKKAAKKNKQPKHQQQQQRGDMEEGGEDDGNGRRRRGLNNLPGAGKVQAIATMAATPASADTQRVTIYLYLLFSAVHMLFIILSCVLSQLDVSGKGCYTFWGFKADCDSVSYTIRASLLQNKQLKQNLQAAAAMSIFAVLTAVGSFCVAWLLVIRVRMSILYEKKLRRDAEGGQDGDEPAFHDLDANPEGDNTKQKKTARYVPTGMLKWAAIGMQGATLIFELIAWAIVAGLYSARPGEDKNLPRGMTYGVGFGLGITAWLCQLIMLGVFVFVV